ncbi:MAG: type I restriction enzyme HsdR N-terminal domain-containing protein [Flavobacteriales bacterium]|nr:type I restriction enzyme HsdR N-terminal domain-containing protein [Flavobacteriales bacterium]MBP6697720.1 type I restriction enzyme HsdR N-terminal domain-containing protein [Flavobacteriales bacterium]
MIALDLPDHGVKTKQGPQGPLVFDPWRRRWVALTPEEWVRQHFLNHLVQDLGCPASMIAVERGLTLNGLSKRADALIHGPDGTPLALVECKAPTVKLVQATFDQAARYNLVFRVPVLLVTNGRTHYACAIDRTVDQIRFLDKLPDYAAMTALALT